MQERRDHHRARSPRPAPSPRAPPLSGDTTRSVSQFSSARRHDSLSTSKPATFSSGLHSSNSNKASSVPSMNSSADSLSVPSLSEAAPPCSVYTRLANSSSFGSLLSSTTTLSCRVNLGIRVLLFFHARNLEFWQKSGIGFDARSVGGNGRGLSRDMVRRLGTLFWIYPGPALEKTMPYHLPRIVCDANGALRPTSFEHCAISGWITAGGWRFEKAQIGVEDTRCHRIYR